MIDTGAFTVSGRAVRRPGNEGERGHLARQLARSLRRRDVACTGVSHGTTARYRLDGGDLAAPIFAAGGARAPHDAPPARLAAEERARVERIGLWGR